MQRVRRFPFAAIVGQDQFKTAYLANIVNPGIGGLLVSGPKGTGKSTIVHSAESILPEYVAMSGCPFNCNPNEPERLCSLCQERDTRETARNRMHIVNLPLSCTEDRLIGSIDIEKLLSRGKKEVQAGILGEANRNVLYIDEVNLLPDHLVDDILDAAALHWNTIEREGVSVSHPSDFVLVGSMNPEEGELRPQILDRFPLCVRVDSIREPGLRVEIVKRNLRFEHDPETFCAGFQHEERAITEAILQARKRVHSVTVDEPDLHVVAASCAELKVDGQRPDIVIVKTGQAVAALRGLAEVGEAELTEAAVLTLAHRTRDGGLLEPPQQDEIRATMARHFAGARRQRKRGENRKTFSLSAEGDAVRPEGVVTRPVVQEGQEEPLTGTAQDRRADPAQSTEKKSPVPASGLE